ncbi:MAG: hypothetical protein PSX37_08255, partial [bacterium]|nr:hypothetical protein [bacterium]
LLVELGGTNANWKRRLKLELAAEVGAADLALEIDKRLLALATSRARVSWRKRPELVADLTTHRNMIVDRLAQMDAGLGFARLVAWFDLFAGLRERVTDPREELAELYLAAAPALASLASRVPDPAIPVLFEALQTRISDWSVWIGRAAPLFDEALATALLTTLTEGRAAPTGRLALVVRRLADRAGDMDAWVASFPKKERGQTRIGSEIATRLASHGRAEEARSALEAARPQAPAPSRLSGRLQALPPQERSPLWDDAEIAVLDAEGRSEEAQAARWAAFERTLSNDHLNAFVARLPDFEDVEAIDRAYGFAANWPDPTQAIRFLIDRMALREAAQTIVARREDLRIGFEESSLWSARLEARYPRASLVLVRARALALAHAGAANSDDVRSLSAEATRLSDLLGSETELETHAEFIDQIDAIAIARRKSWR